MNYKNLCPLCVQKYETKKAQRITEQRLSNGIIRAYAERQAVEHLPCPRCGNDTMSDNVSRNALSRTPENTSTRIFVCDECGMREALEAFDGKTLSLLTWWVIEELFP